MLASGYLHERRIETEDSCAKSPDHAHHDEAYFRNSSIAIRGSSTYLNHNTTTASGGATIASLFTAYDRGKNSCLRNWLGMPPSVAIATWPSSILDNVKSPIRKLEFGPWNHARPNGGSPRTRLQQLADRCPLVEAMAERRGNRNHEGTQGHRFRSRHRPCTRRLSETAPGSYPEFPWPFDGSKEESLDLSATGQLVTASASIRRPSGHRSGLGRRCRKLVGRTRAGHAP